MRIQDAPTPKIYKRERLHMLVAQGSITQQQANELWRMYLRGQIPVVKQLSKIGK